MTGDDEKSSLTPVSNATQRERGSRPFGSPPRERVQGSGDIRPLQTVTKSYVRSHRLKCREVPADKRDIYRNAQEVNEALKEGTFEHRKTTMWLNGKLYFLCGASK